LLSFAAEIFMPYKNLGRKALLRIKQNTKAAFNRRLFGKYVNNPAAIALSLKIHT